MSVGKTYYDKYYLEDYYQEIPKSSPIRKPVEFLENLSFKRKLRLIEKHKPPGNKILEIGCGRGKFLNWLPAHFEKYGMEINKNACQFIKGNYPDITVFNSPVQDSANYESEAPFDIIVMWQVLEHIEHPDRFLKNVSHLLAGNGVLILEIPNRDSLGFSMTQKEWFHIDTPRHLLSLSL
ncbi:hypothetical protein UR09_05030 [Candidatus Nitromaritima sp. SCGC AAA799-A02]|nr:hypothetical protein UR09_05030 [Candidatus Nitromaritima sp. SCGC AAA799-A02]